MSGSSTVPNGGAHERIAKLEAKVSELQSMLAGQAAWMSDMQQEVIAGLQEISGVIQGQASHTEWLTSLERWVSSCVTTLANFGAQPLQRPLPDRPGLLTSPEH